MSHRSKVATTVELEPRCRSKKALYSRLGGPGGCYDVRQVLRCTMRRLITQRELRNESAAVLREVEAGKTFVLTRNGTPVAELRPIQPHRFVPRAMIADAGRRAPRVDARQFRADLDSVIDQRIDD